MTLEHAAQTPAAVDHRKFLLGGVDERLFGRFEYPLLSQYPLKFTSSETSISVIHLIHLYPHLPGTTSFVFSGIAEPSMILRGAGLLVEVVCMTICTSSSKLG